MPLVFGLRLAAGCSVGVWRSPTGSQSDLDFICLYNVVHLEEGKKKLDEEDPLLAQMSALQLIYPDNFALLSGWRMEWLPRINVVTSVWVTHGRDGEMQFIHLCFLWKPFPIIGD